MLDDPERLRQCRDFITEPLPVPVRLGTTQHEQVAILDADVADRHLRVVDVTDDALHEVDCRPVGAVVEQRIWIEATDRTAVAGNVIDRSRPS